MLSVVFNSLLILMPVIAARTVSSAYAGTGLAETPNVESVVNTRQRMDAAFAELSPRSADKKFAFWSDTVAAALAAQDMSTVRGLLLAAPQMLGRELGEQVKLRAEAEAQGTSDERLIRAALTVLPIDLAAAIEAEAASLAPVGAAPVAGAVPASDTPGTGALDRLSARPDPDRRFQMLGTYSDLATLSDRWLNEARADNLVVKLTGFGLVQSATSDGESEATARAASILKSAARSNRLMPAFSAHLEARADAAVPDAVLRPALTGAAADFVTTDVRGERVHAAFASAVDARGASALERDLLQIDRIATLTSPTAALMLIQQINDGADLRRARLLAEAGGDRSIALIQLGGEEMLTIADAGIRWTRNMVLEVMSLTAAGMVLFWVMLSAVRFYVKLPKRKDTLQAI